MWNGTQLGVRGEDSVRLGVGLVLFGVRWLVEDYHQQHLDTSACELNPTCL